MPFPIAAVIGAGAALGGGILDNVFRRKGQKDANKENRRLAKDQRNFSIDMWNRENAYNDPAAQMARLKNAGLNPNLIYGSGAAGAAGNAGDVKGYDRAEAKNVNEGFNVFSNLYQFQNLAAQTDNLKAQADVNKQMAVKAAYDTLNVATDIRKKDFDYGVAEELRDTNVQAARANADQALAEARRSAADANVAEYTQDSRIVEAQAKVDKLGQEIKNLVSSKQAVDLDVIKRKLENRMKEIELEMNERGVRSSDNIIFRMMMKNEAIRGFVDLLIGK